MSNSIYGPLEYSAKVEPAQRISRPSRPGPDKFSDRFGPAWSGAKFFLSTVRGYDFFEGPYCTGFIRVLSVRLIGRKFQLHIN